jgi:hypothetical protein
MTRYLIPGHSPPNAAPREFHQEHFHAVEMGFFTNGDEQHVDGGTIGLLGSVDEPGDIR